MHRTPVCKLISFFKPYRSFVSKVAQLPVWLVWCGLALVLLGPIVAAAMSPLLAWRSGIYIAAGFAGIFAMALIPLQPLAIKGWLPGVMPIASRKLHRALGAALFGAVVLHVTGLWVTSPPDVVDALLLRSPTSFSIWGVISMWAIFGSAILAFLRLHKRIKWRRWRVLHPTLALIAAFTTVAHVLLIDGTMELMTKYALCLAVVVTVLPVVIDLFRSGPAKK